MNTDLDIARWRLRTQRLVDPHWTAAADVLGGLLAVQAENPQQSAWAVAARTDKPDPADLGKLLIDGTVLRTHVLRPTWHYVAAADATWLTELTAPRVRRVVERQLRTSLGLDDRTIDGASAMILAALESAHLTRTELAVALGDRGYALTGQGLMLLLVDLELQALVCSGPPTDDGTHTYARFDDRVRTPRRLDRDAALAELALRYFNGHGPATERDLSYWATLTLTDVRVGLAQVSDQLASFEHDGRTFWHAPGDRPQSVGTPTGHLLQLLDEMYRGYQDSRWVLDSAGIAPRDREQTMGIALVDAQLVAAMKRRLTADQVVFELRPYRELTPDDLAALKAAAERYGTFLDLSGILDY